MYRTIEKHTTNCTKYIPIVGGDFNAELRPGCGSECTGVGIHALNEGNKRGDWMKHGLVSQGYTALNTMYRKTPQKQTTFISPKGNEKQINYILTKRRHLRHNKDAEANDMIHMGSDHRCVVATFMIATPEKSGHCKTGKGKLDTTKHEGRDQIKKNIGVEKPQLGKYQEVIEKFEKKPPTQEKQQRMQKVNMQKRKQKMRMQKRKQKNENAEAEAEEIQGTFKEIMVNDGVETTVETCEGHPGFHTMNEEAGRILLHVEHVEHDMGDDMGERTMTTITNEETGREGTESTESKREDTNVEQTEGV